MTDSQRWILKYGFLGDAIAEKHILLLATTTTMSEKAETVWGKGELTNGGTIQYNENYEVYVSKPPFPRKGNGRGKTGKKIKTGWAPTYLAAKAQVDRAGLPFELTGDLRKAWLGGATPSPREVNPLLCEIVMPDKEFQKAEGLAAQKGEFLEFNHDEVIQHTANVAQAYREFVLGQ